MMETVRGEDGPYWHGYIEARVSLYGVDATETVVLRRKLRRTEMLAFFAAQEPTVIGIGTRAGGMSQGPQLVKQVGVANG